MINQCGVTLVFTAKKDAIVCLGIFKYINL